MNTPPRRGSSRNSGAAIRGKAYGNVANIADIEVESSAPMAVARSIKYGYVYLFCSDDRSLVRLDDMEETSLFFKIQGPPNALSVVLTELEKRYPYTKCTYQYIIYLII